MSIGANICKLKAENSSFICDLRICPQSSFVPRYSYLFLLFIGMSYLKKVRFTTYNLRFSNVPCNRHSYLINRTFNKTSFALTHWRRSFCFRFQWKNPTHFTKHIHKVGAGWNNYFGIILQCCFHSLDSS